MTLEGEQKFKLEQFSGDFPLNHHKQKCKMLPNNNHESQFVLHLKSGQGAQLKLRKFGKITPFQCLFGKRTPFQCFFRRGKALPVKRFPSESRKKSQSSFGNLREPCGWAKNVGGHIGDCPIVPKCTNKSVQFHEVIQN